MTTSILATAKSIIISELRAEPYWCADLNSVTNWLDGDSDIAHDAITELILADAVYVREGQIHLCPKHQRRNS